MSKTMKEYIPILLIGGYGVFVALSFIVSFSPGKEIGTLFYTYSIDSIRMLPCIFVLTGLFDVWVRKETVEKNLGKDSGFIGYAWALLLGGLTIGPMIVSLPIALSLFRKGAGFSVLFTYIGAASVCRIPMTLLEASYLGIPFTVVRYVVSIPLIILSAVLFGAHLEKIGYRPPLQDEKQDRRADTTAHCQKRYVSPPGREDR